MPSAIALAIERFVQDLTNLPVDHSIDHALENALVAEHEIRLLLASDPQNAQLHDMFLGLLDIFKVAPAARRHRARPVDFRTTDFNDYYVFPVAPRHRRSSLSPSTVPDMQAFNKNWEIFTHRALLKMSPKDWNNVIAAGGSVLACLRSTITNPSSRRLNQFYQSPIHANSDINLFLWGLTPAQVVIN